MHPRDAAGYGSKRLRQDGRDNVGKGHLPAGTGDNLQRLRDRGLSSRRGERGGLAHEPVGAMKEA